MKPHLLIAVLLVSLLSTAAGEAPFTAGEILLRIRDGTRETNSRYRFHDTRLRIDNSGEAVPAPAFNLIDLATGTVRIVHPHNGTWQEIPAEVAGATASAHPGLLVPPPGIGPRRMPDIQPAGVPVPPSRIGPDLHGVPPVPDLPQRPALPAGPDAIAPPGIGRPPGSGMVIVPPTPPVPLIPGLGVSSVVPLELTATTDEREIHGFRGTCHIVSLPREGEMTLWLADPGRLPPFHLLLDDVPLPREFLPWEQRIAALLREKDRFPLLAELRGPDGSPQVCWEVTAVLPNTPVDRVLFEIPPEFHRLPAR